MPITISFYIQKEFALFVLTAIAAPMAGWAGYTWLESLQCPTAMSWLVFTLLGLDDLRVYSNA
ncbi:MAG TPA: hypothetical protein VNV85_17755 [Puia sp.]|nr:hypothetical protein [Puia sp.]